MKILAISGSGRASSTNTAMLRAVSQIAVPAHEITVFSAVAGLPVFSPDLEQSPLPPAVQHFAGLVGRADGLIIASPEYVRAIPGGLKNAIDWLVSRDEIIDKPIALLHASHRGDEMLAQLRLVLSTVSQGFYAEVFASFALMKRSPDEITAHLNTAENRAEIIRYLASFAQHSAR